MDSETLPSVAVMDAETVSELVEVSLSDMERDAVMRERLSVTVSDSLSDGDFECVGDLDRLIGVMVIVSVKFSDSVGEGSDSVRLEESDTDAFGDIEKDDESSAV